MINAKLLRENKAFTIVELVIVVVVIAILATIAVVGYNAAVSDADEVTMKSDLRTAHDALELYKFEGADKHYPEDISDINISPTGQNEFDYSRDAYRDEYCLSITNPNLEGVQFHVTNSKNTPSEGPCGEFAAGPAPESCFAFNSGTGAITSYYHYEGNSSANPACPKDVVIPRTIGGVEVKTLGGFSARVLQSVVIPNTVTTISSAAFAQNALKSVVIPFSVSSIGQTAFFQNQISSLSLPESLLSIGQAAFNNNRLPDDQAFIYHRNADGSEDRSRLVSYGGLKKSGIVVPNNVRRIENQGMFYSGIQSVNLHENITFIGANAFSNNGLTSITFNTSVSATSSLTIGNDAFRYNNISSITFSDYYVSAAIGLRAFQNNSSTVHPLVLPNCSSYTASGTDRSFGTNVTPITNYCVP